MKISRINIKRFRSILSLNLDIDITNNFITICGVNNSGKTNVLKALNIFFNPEKYIAHEDSPNHKYYGSRGGKSYPEISLWIQNGSDEIVITREFGYDNLQETKCWINDLEQNQTESNKVLKQFAFFFVPSINISFPDLINDLIDDVYELEYEKTRFRGLKQELKQSYENYISGIVQILNQLAEEINPIFQEFNEAWTVGFENTSDIYRFKDLISEDIEFYLNDKSSRNIDGKGSGLQRLGFILLHSRIIAKLKKKNVIFCIDEPDVYLHHGLQKKLKSHLLEIASNSQVIVTTHSPIFIDSYKLNNVFLLDLIVGEEVTYSRTGKTFYPLDTTLVDLNEHDGLKKIQNYLGIENDDFEILDKYNILVEGDCDKKYLSELGNFFNIELAKIIPVHGASKFDKYLEFYESFYESREFKPCLLIVMDNDDAGREEYRKLVKKVNSYRNISVKIEFIPTCHGHVPSHDDVIKNQIKSNFEVEDFIYPELLVENSNVILKKRSYKTIRFNSVESKIGAPAFKEKGILYNIDFLKNEKNPENGHFIDFSTEQVKQGLSGLFNLRGNKKLAIQIQDLDVKYPSIKNYLERIMNVTEMIK